MAIEQVDLVHLAMQRERMTPAQICGYIHTKFVAEGADTRSSEQWTDDMRLILLDIPAWRRQVEQIEKAIRQKRKPRKQTLAPAPASYENKTKFLVRQKMEHVFKIRHREALWKMRQFDEQQGVCRGCGDSVRFCDFERDHIHPKSKEGTDDEENLQLLCHYCNVLKGKGTMDALKHKIRMRPNQYRYYKGANK